MPHIWLRYQAMLQHEPGLENQRQVTPHVAQEAHHVRRGLYQLLRLLPTTIVQQRLYDEHQGFLHRHRHAVGQGIDFQQRFQRVALCFVKGSGRGKQRLHHLLHVRRAEKAQLFQLAGLASVNELGGLERLPAEGTAVVPLEGERTLGNKVAAA